MFEITDFTSTTRWERECEKYKNTNKVSDQDLKENQLVLKTLVNISQDKPNYEIGNFKKLNNSQNFEITTEEISLGYFPFGKSQEFIDYFIFKINLKSLNSPKFKTFKCIKSTSYSVSMDHFDLKLKTLSHSNHQNNLEDSTILSGNSIGISTMAVVFPTYFHKWAKSKDISRIIAAWEQDDVHGLGFVDKKDLRIALQGILASNPKKSKSSSKPLKIKEPPFFPKDSLLWEFSKRILDAASVKPKFLSHETHLIPFLRGFWMDFKYFVKHVCIKEGLYLPGIESINDSNHCWNIEYKHCLLHQKLTLLNICIHHSNQREDKIVKYSSVFEHPFVKDSIETELGSPIEKTINMSKKLFKVFTEKDEKQGLDDILGVLSKESWNLVKNEVLFEASPDSPDMEDVNSSWGLAGSPDGRLCKSDWISLGTGEPIYIPVTQDPVQLTEDDLLSLQTKLVELGTSKEGARLRAKLQCENLRSDMQAFKAANPGCILADFVRWHSPKDFIENGESGLLSSRMTEPGNLWEELWNTAEPTAASFQKPLFNFEQTITEIMEYLDSISVHDLLDWIVPTVLYMHFTKLTSDEVFSYFSHVQNLADCFAAEWARIDWKSLSVDNDYSKVTNLLNLLTDIDEFCNHAWALIKIFPNDLEFIQTVILSQDFSTSDFPDSVKADLETLLAGYIKSEDLLPVSQEFEFSTDLPLPSPCSRKSLQKIVFTISEDEFIIKEVFSYDTLWL